MPRPNPQTGDGADLHFETTARHNKSRIPSSRLNTACDTDSSAVAYTPPSSEQQTALPHRKVGHPMPSGYPHLENKDEGARDRVARHITALKLAKNNIDAAFDSHSTSLSEVNDRPYGQSQKWPAQHKCDSDIFSPYGNSMLRDQSYGWQSKARRLQDEMPQWGPDALGKTLEDNSLRASSGGGVLRPPADLSGVATVPLYSSNPVRDHMHASLTQGSRTGLTDFLEQELAKAKKELERAKIVDEGRHPGIQLSPRQKVEEGRLEQSYPYFTPAFSPTLMTFNQVRVQRNNQQYTEPISPSLQHEQLVHAPSDNIVWDLETEYHGLGSPLADPCGSGECGGCDKCGFASIAQAPPSVYSNPAWTTHPSFEHSVLNLPVCRPLPSQAQTQDCTLHISQSTKPSENQASTDAQLQAAKLVKTTHGQFSISEATEVLKMCHGHFRMAEAMYHASGVESMRHMLGAWQSETCLASTTQDTESHADSSGDAGSGSGGNLASKCRGCRSGCDACCPIGVEKLSFDDDYDSGYGRDLDAACGDSWGGASGLKLGEDRDDLGGGWGIFSDMTPARPGSSPEPPFWAFPVPRTTTGCRWSEADDIPKEDERECTSTPAIHATSTKGYTVTYWATIESDDQTVHIPIENNSVSGPEKAVLEGPAKTVWKWIQEKGLGDKVGLQDVFDLAKDIHIGVEDTATLVTDQKHGHDDCPSHQEPKCWEAPASLRPSGDSRDDCGELSAHCRCRTTGYSQDGWGG
ncbi:hypothetical protein HBI25_175840 [Parastagonospora nodorum]|nr:hypothetical protein HBI25_175840 [Parastagonospora nodorum]KAH5651080.1 hypothetical protein HBI51_084930 [Parastagonospora nodorum]KAH6338897.1 hypothetical protein HBI36_206290 [Parastagonospora nodorum]KAH6344157.1 hypothetical protein HBI37_090580 [Parastagonospora nodorum]